jgi:hypothetical protein
MTFPKVGKFAPVNLGHMRANGCRDLVVYCTSCHTSWTLNVGHLSDDTPIKSLGDRIACARCGRVATDIQPDWGRS